MISSTRTNNARDELRRIVDKMCTLVEHVGFHTNSAKHNPQLVLRLSAVWTRGPGHKWESSHAELVLMCVFGHVFRLWCVFICQPQLLLISTHLFLLATVI